MVENYYNLSLSQTEAVTNIGVDSTSTQIETWAPYYIPTPSPPCCGVFAILKVNAHVIYFPTPAPYPNTSTYVKSGFTLWVFLRQFYRLRIFRILGSVYNTDALARGLCFYEICITLIIRDHAPYRCTLDGDPLKGSISHKGSYWHRTVHDRERIPTR